MLDRQTRFRRIVWDRVPASPDASDRNVPAMELAGSVLRAEDIEDAGHEHVQSVSLGIQHERQLIQKNLFQSPCI
jgi:hypothetical protein